MERPGEKGATMNRVITGEVFWTLTEGGTRWAFRSPDAAIRHLRSVDEDPADWTVEGPEGHCSLVDDGSGRVGFSIRLDRAAVKTWSVDDIVEIYARGLRRELERYRSMEASDE
jgi:hypothetical protein